MNVPTRLVAFALLLAAAFGLAALAGAAIDPASDGKAAGGGAAGRFEPVRPPAPAATARTAGYEVTLRAPGLRAGREVDLTFVVRRGGRPVADLERYLGAKGHLMALRGGDLGYLPVRPQGAPERADDGAISFGAGFPTAGAYRLFLQFKHDGAVRTVDFTLEVPR